MNFHDFLSVIFITLLIALVVSWVFGGFYRLFFTMDKYY